MLIRLSFPAPRHNVTRLTTPVLLSAFALVLSACGGGAGSASVTTASAATTASPSPDSNLSSTGLEPKTPVNDPSCLIQYSSNVTAEKAGPDPLLNQQWHLKNTGQFKGKTGEDINVEAAWAQSQGEGVRVALVDDALEVVHGDLQGNVATGGSFNYRPAVKGSAFPLPCTSEDSHGTSVAGIIASRASNAIGTVGIAPKAQLVGYNALSLDLTADVADALTRDMAINSVYNNSWGSPDNGEGNEAEPEFYSAIARGIQSGRQGKGAIYVFPAGNGGCYTVAGLSTCQRDNANFDGYVNRLGVITVGATDQNGRQPWYGEQGANVLVSAPAGDAVAGITTTAIGNSYRSDFMGTSASAPMATGVIALMLGVNPNLSWRDVPLILAHTARKNHTTDAGWANGFNHKYGFGVIDAAAAVTMAKSWTTVGGSESLKNCTTSVSGQTLAVPDMGAAVSSTLNLDTCGIKSIEFVSVTVQIDHEYSGDLNVELLSPRGNTSTLATQRLCVQSDRAQNHCGSMLNWQFGSVRHLDETAAGNWRLSVKDMVAGKLGSLKGWSITVYGR